VKNGKLERCPTYYHLDNDKKDHRSNKEVLMGFSRGVKVS